MTDYNDGKWHGWNGGECPVHPKTEVKYVTDNGEKHPRGARDLQWSSDTVYPIRAFRVVKEHKEPREFWLLGRAILHEDPDSPHAIHVREVLE